MPDRNPNPALLPTALQAAILKRLERVEDLLVKKVADLPVEEAVGEYLAQHISRTKKPKNYQYLMDRFKEAFAGRNLPEVPAEEIEVFIQENWEGQNTRAQRATQLRGFFEWSNKYLMKKGKPSFANPMALLEFPAYRGKPKHVLTEQVKAMIEAAETDRDRLIVSILATTGMRAGELAEMRPEDVNGRVITIRNPKSRRWNSPEGYSELTVVPQSVHRDLRAYLAGEKPAGRLLGSYKAVHTAIKRLAKKVGADITPHDLRRFCASWYDRHERWSMVQFVLRHRNGAHKGLGGDRLASAHYVAPLNPQEAMVEQEAMEKELFGGAGENAKPGRII